MYAMERAQTAVKCRRDAKTGSVPALTFTVWMSRKNGVNGNLLMHTHTHTHTHIHTHRCRERVGGEMFGRREGEARKAGVRRDMAHHHAGLGDVCCLQDNHQDAQGRGRGHVDEERRGRVLVT